MQLNHRARCFVLFGSLGAALISSSDSSGAIRSLNDGAFLRYDASLVPSEMLSGPFSVIAFVRPDALPATGDAGILDIESVLAITLDATGGLTARLSRDTGAPVMLEALATVGAVPGEWLIVGVGFDPSAGELRCIARGETVSVVSATDSLPGFMPGPTVGPITLGRSPGVSRSVEGALGVVAIRDHSINETDIDAILDSRLYHAPYALESTPGVGSMSGPDGCVLMLNHGVASDPVPGVGLPGAAPASIIGMPLATDGALVFSRAFDADVLAVHECTTDSFTHASPYDPPLSGFFQRTTPSTGAGHSTAGLPGPLTLSLANDAPSGLVRVITSANSRAVVRQDQPGTTPATVVGEAFIGNYTEGFWGEFAHRTAGALLVPADTQRTPFFGFDTFTDPARFSGAVLALRDAPPGASDFQRFWTNSETGATIAPGSGAFLPPPSTYALKCAPAGLIAADEPLHVRAHVLRFPGASDVRWRSAQEESQSAGTQITGSTPGVDSFFMVLDSTRFAPILAPADLVVSAQEIHLAGDRTPQVLVGDACFLPLTNGPGAISVVVSVAFDGVETRVVLEHPLGVLPQTGDELRFGDWGFRTLAYDWPGLGAGDPRTWRGLEIEAEDDGRAGVVLLAFSARRPGVDGFAFGTAGWGGNGYRQQIDEPFARATTDWMALTGADIWFVAPAQQSGNTDTMRQFTELIVSALPSVEIVWAGEGTHGNALGEDRPFENWHNFILANAAIDGHVGVSALEHPAIGTYLQQLADGLRSNQAHISGRGNARVVGAWLELLRSIEQVDGDANLDGMVNIEDVIFVIFRLGQVPAPGIADGDVNDDGVVDTSDIVYVIFRFDAT